jgi:TonB family protein
MLVHRSERYPQADGTTLCVVHGDVPPFSFCSYIVMNHSDYEAHEAAVLAHERGHIRQHHSCDVLLVDLLTALQWFNPAMWMLRQDLRAIHEYEADGAVLSQGINARQYQYLLITKAASIGGYSIANGISHSTLKNRIAMMLHKKSPRSSFLKLLALIPIVGVALALNAETVYDYVYQQPQKKIIKKGKKNTTVKTDTVNELVVVAPPAQPQQVEPVEMPNPLKVDQKKDRAFDVVEEMPQFPGGPSALYEYLAANIRYPKAAHKAGVQGRVILTFVVEKDGSISGTEVVKSVSPLLDAEAVRVINAMPNWVPGRQNGKVVRVKYAVPVSFMLQDDSPKKMTEGGTFNTNEYDIEVDGKLVDIETLKTITPANIESMDVQKPKDGQGKGRIIVKMKQKKE